MRKSYLQHEVWPHKQKEEQREGESSKEREKRKGGGGGSVGAKKRESPEAEAETKKLERKPTEDINASAEAFINNFRKQLQIQRLQSIENYNQMLARGL